MNAQTVEEKGIMLPFRRARMMRETSMMRPEFCRRIMHSPRIMRSFADLKPDAR